MNIKSLLLGSAAALVAVSGARAADAIFAEPEPVEFVRVCDVYGSGFFYIPGTETCLRIGGEVRYQIGTAGDDDNYHGFEDETWTKQSRGRFFLDARSDTEWGTLRGFIRADLRRDTNRGASSGAANNPVVNKAFIELGGLKMGFEDSAFVFTPNAGAANYGSHSDSGLFYGYNQANLVQYNFSGGNGFFATVSLEDDNQQGGNSRTGSRTAGPDFILGSPDDIVITSVDDDNYIPDVVVKAGINQGWGAVWAAVGYDEAIGFTGDDDGGYSVVGGLHFNMPNMAGSSFRLLGFYSDSANRYSTGYEWSVLASYYHQFSPTIGASVGFQYLDNAYVAGTDLETDDDAWAAELNVVWTPVENFAVRTELVYFDGDDGFDGDDDGALSGFVRFSRFF